MLSYDAFSLVIMLSILFPVAGLVILLLLNFLEKEVNILEIENKKVNLERELQQSKFLQLNQQIQPHFLFNTLNAITSLGRLGRVEDSVESLEKLSLFLRYNYLEKDPLVPFYQELEHTEHYLSIQRLRFGTKLKVDYRIDPLAQDTLLPPYALQTLIENAFKHGLDKKSGDKLLSISLSREGNWISLTVLDNGPGHTITDDRITDNEISNAKSTEVNYSTGVGLKNLRKRFEITFDGRTSLNLNRQNDFTEAKLSWPYTPEVKL